MKKQLRYFFTLLLLAVTSVGWAQDVFYTLTPANGSNNSYAGNCDITVDGITWNLNGNSQQLPWRLGGKNLTDTDRTLYSKTSMESAISKVSMEIESISLTVNSFKLTVASDADFSTVIDEVTATVEANKTIDITPSSGSEWASGAYYKFTFNVTTSGTSNQFVQFAKAEFYKGTASGKSPAGLAYATATMEKKLGDAAFTNTLTNPNNLAITYTSSDGNVATVSSNGLVTIKGVGTTTITASSEETNDYLAGNASYTITVTDPNAPGTENNPYTVAQAIAAIDGGSTAYAYVKGIISKIDNVNTDYGNATYWISDDGTTTNQFEIYRGKYLEGAAFTSADQIAVGDQVVVYGKLTKYGDTYELGSGNTLISIVHEGKEGAGLAYATATVEKNLGDAAFTNLLTNPHDLEITYTSSDETVATVDANGEVTILAAGTTTITATSEETDDYLAGEASYTLTVTNNASVIDLRGKTEGVTFTTLNSFIHGSGYNSYETASITADDGTTYAGWSATDVMTGDGSGLQLKASSGRLFSPQILSDKGVLIEVKTTANSVNIIVGDDSSDSGELATTSTEANFTLSTGEKYTKVTSITITPLSENVKLPAGLAYAITSMEKNVGDEPFTNELTNPNELTVTYTSSDETVATVDENGVVTILAEGTTTITATYEEDDTYAAGEASYELTVTNNITVIDLRGKTEALTFTTLNSFIHGNGYNDYTSASITATDGATYGGWSAKRVMTGDETGLQMEKKNGKLVSPQILSDKGVLIEVTVSINTVTITAGEESSDEGFLSTGSTDTHFTLSTGEKYTKVTSITITPLSENIKLPAGLAYATATVEKNLGDEPFTNELTNPNELAVTYTSSDEDVATVDENGEVTILAEGTTTITATSEETDEYKPGTASYTLTVTKPVEPQKDNEDIYELVKDASTLADGDIIIIVGENTVPAAEEGAEPRTDYYGLGINQKSNNREAVTVTYNTNGTITGNNKLEAITLEGQTGAWYFNVEDGYLYAADSGNNYLRTETEADDNAKATITIADDKATILFQGENTRNDLRFNYSSNNPLFSCYASTSEMPKAKIYRLVEVEEGLLGDANGDKDVTVADVTVVVNCIKNGVMDDIIFKNADVDGDGDITVTDVTLIVAIIRQ